MKKIKDERIVQLTNKILGETYFVVMLLLIVSIIIKSYIMNMPFTHCITELSVMIVSTIYIVIRSMLTGNTLLNTSKRNKILTILAILGLSLAVAIHNGVRNYTTYGDQYNGIFDFHFLAVLVVTFLSSAALISAIYLFYYLCHIRGNQKIEQEILSDDDDNEE